MWLTQHWYEQRDREEAGSTSLVMQPSLLRSYRLKAQLSLSVMEPLKIMDRLTTKSCSADRENPAVSKPLYCRLSQIVQSSGKVFTNWMMFYNVIMLNSPQSWPSHCCWCQKLQTGNVRTCSSLEEKEKKTVYLWVRQTHPGRFLWTGLCAVLQM